MDTLLHFALGNALLATLLAVPAAAVSVFGRRPALAHGLWLLVLLKLVTPPILRLPVPAVWESPAPAAAATEPPAPSETLMVELPAPTPDDFADLPAGDVDVDVPAPTAPAPQPLPAFVPVPAPPPAEAAPVAAWGDARPALLGVWAAGSVAWLAMLLVRVQRFRRLLQHAWPAPAPLVAEVRDLARRLGLPRCPEVVLVPGPVSPMLWSIFGPARLIVPVELLDRLDAAQRATLLAHELAHLRRRDHWVRLLELLAAGLYWWHPVVWWARRALREAEEQCCDAWVVWLLPEAAKAYAVALLETVNFLTDALAVPPAASGVGQFPILQRRLTMIMCGTHPRSLSATGFIAVAALGVGLLPWAPGWAQEEPKSDRPLVERKAVEIEVQAREEARKADDPAKAAEIEKRKAEAQQLADEFARARAHLEEIAKRFAEAQRRLAELAPGDQRVIILRDAGPVTAASIRALMEPRATGLRTDGGLGGAEEVAALTAQLKGKEAQVQEARARLDQAMARLQRKRQLVKDGLVDRSEGEAAVAEVTIAEAQLKGKMAEQEEFQIRLDAAKKRAAAPSAPPLGQNETRVRVSGGLRSAAAPPLPPTPPLPLAAGERRLDDLERKLADLLKEIQSLRQDMARPGTRTAPANPAPFTPAPAPR